MSLRRPYVRPSFHKVSSISVKFSMLAEVGKWCMMVCSMTRSKVKVKVTSPWKSEIRPFLKAISSSIYNGAGKWPRILKLGGNTKSLSGTDFWFLSYILCHVTLKLAVSRSRPPVPYGANFCFYCFRYFIVSVPCAGLSWPSRQLLSAR